MSDHKIICGKSEIELKQFEDNTFDSGVIDSPYGLEFMGKDWDRLSGGFSDGKFKGFHLPQTSGGNRNVKCPDCGKWVYDHYPRNCTCGGVERYKSRKMQEWHYQWATELYRVMKPGAHILVFGGTRTYHRMACAVEDAGFEVRDMIEWVYGSGFPKSLDVSKSLDKRNGKEREVISKNPNARDTCGNINICKKNGSGTITAPTTEEAIQWDGFGTGLKPAHEPILLARKPISERNIASNVLKWGVGGLNIGECRIGYLSNRDKESARIGFANIGWKHSGNTKEEMTEKEYDLANQQGRFPADIILECCCECDELIEAGDPTHPGQHKNITNPNSIFGIGTGEINKNRITCEKGNKCLIHTNPNCVCRMLDEQSGELKTGEMNSIAKGGQYAAYGYQYPRETVSHKSKGGASRFFYQAKASQAERWFYCTVCKAVFQMINKDAHIHGAPEKTKYQFLEFHPTQKPADLICYLMRLITPPNGLTIDPFLGSGTAIIAAEREGFNCVGIDRKHEYCEMSYRRGKGELIQQKISGEPSTIEKTGF